MSRSAEMRARLAEVVKVALVGASRQTLAPGGPLARLALVDDPEATLLAEAAALGLAARAAMLPARCDLPPPRPAAGETLPRCPPGAARLLAGFLAGEHDELLPEWLSLAARAGVRADEVLLPALLDLGRSRPELRGPIAAVLGERGRWLAAELGEPGWGWALAPPAAEGWAAGTRAERLALLAALRARDPAEGRRLVESTFAEDAAEERAAFVAGLATGLSDADEPFLEERALADRRKEVRLAAAALLARLPRSRLAGRMAERALRQVSLATGEVRPPHAFDDALARDGLEQSPPRGEGARAFWLRQMVAAAPLSIWGPPEAALAAARKSEWLELLLGAWAVAAARQRDAAWAEAILGVTLDLPDLIAVVPPERAEKLAARALRADPEAALALLAGLRHAWSEPFSRWIVPALRSSASARAAFVTAAPRLHPRVVAELVAEGFESSHAVLERRAAMHKELSSS